MPEHPTVRTLLKDSAVRSALCDAWGRSFGGLFFSPDKGDRSLAFRAMTETGFRPGRSVVQVREQGGWIFQNRQRPDCFHCVPTVGDGENHIDLRTPPIPGGDWYLVATYHSHPNPPVDIGDMRLGEPRPSNADLDNAAFNRVPGLIVTWALSKHNRTLSRQEHPVPSAGVSTLNRHVGADEVRPHTFFGTVFAYGPSRREGWCDGDRGFPKERTPDRKGFVPLDEIAVEGLEFQPLDAVSGRIREYCDLVGKIDLARQAG